MKENMKEQHIEETNIKKNDARKNKLDNIDLNNIDFAKLDITDIISLCLKCENEEDAKKVLEQYEKYCDTPEIARENLGYIFGYCDSEDRKKLYSLFPVNHPAFGPGFGRGNDPTPEDAFAVGKKLGMAI